MVQGNYHILDYAIFIATLTGSMLIGGYYAFVKKQRTTEELIVGNRNVGVLPATLSLSATIISGITLLGYSGEIYDYGTLFVEGMLAGALLWVPWVAVLFLPTLYGLRLTSAYTYLELRFNSKAVKYVATLTYMFKEIAYSGVLLYAPALALGQVTGIPIWVSILASGGCATLYASIGGFRAVIWTDSLQILMMFTGMIAIIVKGTINVGGISNVIEIANNHSRLEYLNMAVDPFLRHSTLNLFFGQGPMFIAIYACSQTTIQRYSSMGSMTKAVVMLLGNVPLIALIMLCAGTMGVVVFANYAGCDPLASGLIKKSDQIAPFFVADKLDTPGIMGLFIAGIFSGAMSTISSVINSLAALTWEDFISKLSCTQALTENRKGKITQCIGIVYGLMAIGLAFSAQNLSGIVSLTNALIGTMLAPILGAFTLGVFVPWANKWGALTGMLVSNVVAFGFTIGSRSVNRPTPKLSHSISMCSNETLNAVTDWDSVYAKLNATAKAAMNIVDPIEWPQKMFTMSYTLYPLMGVIITILVGMIVSAFTGGFDTIQDKEFERYIHPIYGYLNERKREKRNKEIIEMCNR